MGDVAQILGGVKSKNAAKPAPPPPLPAGSHPSRSMRMAGMPKEVMDLVGGNQDPNSAALPPAVPSFSGFAATTSGGANTNGETDTGAANSNGNISSTAGQTIKIGNKWIDTKKPARKWVWAPFASSARTDGLLLNHWIRAEVEYPDYPYARFNCHLDPVTYTDEEYRDKLHHESWTKSETGQLMELARKFELRWPVIYDRWFDMYHTKTSTTTTSPQDSSATNNQQAQVALSRKIEDLQHRYYSVAAIITQHRIAQEAAAEAQALAASVPDANSDDPKAAADALLIDTTASRTVAATDPKHQPLIHNLGSGTTNKVFDLNYEKERRAHLELLWHRSKEEEEEEDSLRKELRLVEAQIRKLKKTGGHILAAANSNAANTGAAAAGAPGAAAAAASGSAASSRDASRSASPAISAEAIASKTPGALLDQSFASTAPTPMPGTPYLQSGRLAHPATGGAMGLNKTLLGRMDSVLAELKISPRPIPTKRVCDLYDSVRKDILTLLTLQKMALQKEGQLQSKRLKLSKMGGSIKVADEETALGVPKPQPTPAPAPQTPAHQQAAAAAAATAGTSSKTKPAATKAKATAGGGKAKGSTDPTKGSAATKAKGEGKAKSGEGSGGKQGSAGGKGAAGGKQAPTTAAKQTSAATGGKQTPGGKQAASGGAKASASGGKQAPGTTGGKGGKSAKKPAAKRKRKSEAKSATAASGAPAPAATAPAPSTTNTSAGSASAAGPAPAPPSAGAPVPAPQASESEGGSKAKKRPRKS